MSMPTKPLDASTRASLIASQWLAHHLAEPAEICPWEDLPGLTEEEYERVLFWIESFGRRFQGEVDRWVGVWDDPDVWARIWEEATA